MTDDFGSAAARRVDAGHALLFAVVLAVGIALRFYRITVLPAALYPDEAFYGTDTLRSMASRVWRVFYPLNNGHEGLIVWLHAPFILMFGTTPWVLRLQLAEFARCFTAAGRDRVARGGPSGALISGYKGIRALGQLSGKSRIQVDGRHGDWQPARKGVN